MKKVVAVIGTRADGIKMCPVIAEILAREDIELKVCSTGQHGELLDEVLKSFGIEPHYDLGIMKKDQDLFDVTLSALSGMKQILSAEMPDCVLVHGDTTSSFCAALAAFYLHIPVYHVEAGLRTGDMTSPFPEEFNRRAIALMAEAHFAPTDRAMENLISENIPEENIFVTGNTVVDAMRTVRTDMPSRPLEYADNGWERVVLMTVHRRENCQGALEEIFSAVNQIVCEFPDVLFIYPVHPNPILRSEAERILGGCDRVVLCEPLGVVEFHDLIRRCYMVLTDSGGVQEEATAMGKPVLVARNTTERTEGIRSGNIRLVGVSRETVYRGVRELLVNPALHYAMSNGKNPYGDGKAAKRICNIVDKKLNIG